MTRAVAAVALALVPSLLLGGCGGNGNASSSPQQTVTVTASPSAGAASDAPTSDLTATALTLRGLCDNLSATFRTGGQSPLQYWRYLSTVLQGVSDVSQPSAKRALQPMVDAATKGAAAGSHAGDDVFSNRFKAAYDQMDKTCLALGSEGLA